jgi:nascent polypeptide-associated complex subunit alpha
MMRGGNREMRRMLDKMGLEMKDLGNIEEVVIKTDISCKASSCRDEGKR